MKLHSNMAETGIPVSHLTYAYYGCISFCLFNYPPTCVKGISLRSMLWLLPLIPFQPQLAAIICQPLSVRSFKLNDWSTASCAM